MSAVLYRVVFLMGIGWALFLFWPSVAGKSAPAASEEHTSRREILPADHVAVEKKTDFNADGYADLVVGIPLAKVEGNAEAGLVHVFYGTPGGLLSATRQIWSQNSPGVQDTAEEGDQFGWSVVTGDFNGDIYDDLAVSAWYEDLEDREDTGLVHIFYGSSAGLTAAGNQLWWQGRDGKADAAEPHDWFGFALAAADFNGDGYEDLAGGAPGEDADDIENMGAVSVAYGSPVGLLFSSEQFWSQRDLRVPSLAERYDAFGDAVAAGDFDGDGFADLAVGVPGEMLRGRDNAGVVNIFYGSLDGLRLDRAEIWWQGNKGLADEAEVWDRFGLALAVGDFDSDGFDDLAIGAPGEDFGNQSKEGAVSVMRGSAAGLVATGNMFWALTQDKSEVFVPEERARNATGPEGYRFGQVLVSGDLDGDGFDDLAVGAPRAVFSDHGETNRGSGVVSFARGSAAGLLLKQSGFWSGKVCRDVFDGETHATPVPDSSRETWPQTREFGHALAAGDFDGNGRVDLVVGAPAETDGAALTTGSVHIAEWDGETLVAAREKISADADLTTQDNACLGARDTGIRPEKTRFGHALG